MSDPEDDIPTLIERDTTPIESGTRVPLTIISGFLGAGKSTLLKRILTERHGYRIAVIMNEFADTADIESKTINVSSPDDPTAEQSEEILELANGCLCCSIKNTGAASIERLMQRKGAFDYILLETTGLADPGPIASMFWHNEEFASGLGRDIKLDGVVCVIDAVYGRKQIQEERTLDTIGECLRQIAGSDVILLNKYDLVGTNDLDLTEDLIQQINPTAPVHRTIRGDVDLRHIIGISAYNSAPRLEPRKATTAVAHDHEDCDEEHAHDHLPEPTHYEQRGISSLQITVPALTQANFDLLDEWLRSVLWEKHIPGGSGELDILRCKGLITTVSGEQYVLQGVRELYELEKVGVEVDLGVPEPGKIVLIGKGLDGSVRDSLNDLFA